MKTLQEYIDAAQDGEVVLLPAGRIVGGAKVTKQISIVGQNTCFNRLKGGTLITAGAPGTPLIEITHPLGNIHLAYLQLDGEDKAPGILCAPKVGEYPSNILIERCSADHCTSYGMAFLAEDGAGVNLLRLRDCQARWSSGDGIKMSGIATPSIEGGSLSANAGRGIITKKCEQVRIREVYLEGNAVVGGDAPTASIVIQGGHSHVVQGCTIEDFGTLAGAHGIYIDGVVGAQIRDNYFMRGGTSGIGQRVTGNSKQVYVGPQVHAGVPVPSKVDVPSEAFISTQFVVS